MPQLTFSRVIVFLIKQRKLHYLLAMISFLQIQVLFGCFIILIKKLKPLNCTKKSNRELLFTFEVMKAINTIVTLHPQNVTTSNYHQ